MSEEPSIDCFCCCWQKAGSRTAGSRGMCSVWARSRTAASCWQPAAATAACVPGRASPTTSPLSLACACTMPWAALPHGMPAATASPRPSSTAASLSWRALLPVSHEIVSTITWALNCSVAVLLHGKPTATASPTPSSMAASLSWRTLPPLSQKIWEHVCLTFKLRMHHSSCPKGSCSYKMPVA